MKEVFQAAIRLQYQLVPSGNSHLRRDVQI